MRTTFAAAAAVALTSASLLVCMVGSSTSAFASPPGMGGGGHPTGTSRSFTGNGPAVNGWGPHFTRREGYIPGAIGTPPAGAIKVPGAEQTSGTPQIVKCPCTLEKDPLVRRPLFGGVPNNMIADLKLGVGSVLDFRAGIFQHPLTGADNPTTATQAFNAMVTTWGPRFDPKDFPVNGQQQVASGHQQMWPTDREH